MPTNKRFIAILVTITTLAAAGVAWTEMTHRPQTHELAITGMSCEGCAAGIKDHLANLPGVTDVVVSHQEGAATFTIDGWSKTTAADAVQAIEAAGYKVAP